MEEGQRFFDAHLDEFDVGSPSRPAVAEVGSVCVWAAAAAAASLSVPFAARCRAITKAIRTPRKLSTAIIQEAAARPEASASPCDAPSEVWLPVTVA